MPYSDWHFRPFFRVFVQLKSSEEEGREPGPRPTDRKRLHINQAFVDFSYPRTVLPVDQAYVTLRLGRQEIDFGDERLLAVREGPMYVKFNTDVHHVDPPTVVGSLELRAQTSFHLWCVALNLSPHRDMIGVQAPLGQKFLHVTV
jgi:hypothetical protein